MPVSVGYMIAAEKESGVMAAIAEISQNISEVTKVPLGTVKHIARRLGEDELLPRGPRGPNAPDFGDIHIARLLVGVMTIANGIDHTGANIARAVKRIEDLSKGGVPRVEIHVDGDPDDPMVKSVLIPTGSFVETVAYFIRLTQNPVGLDRINRRIGRLLAIGLTFGGGAVYGWIEFASGATNLNHVSDVRRINYGIMGDVLASGMTQDVRVGFDALRRLGELLKTEIPEVSPTASPETTTPASGGTGPATVVVSQPGATPVKLDALAKHQNSDAEEREQALSGPIPAHSSESLGSPPEKGPAPSQDKVEPPWPNTNRPMRCAS